MVFRSQYVYSSIHGPHCFKFLDSNKIYGLYIVENNLCRKFACTSVTLTLTFFLISFCKIMEYVICTLLNALLYLKYPCEVSIIVFFFFLHVGIFFFNAFHCNLIHFHQASLVENKIFLLIIFIFQ